MKRFFSPFGFCLVRRTIASFVLGGALIAQISGQAEVSLVECGEYVTDNYPVVAVAADYDAVFLAEQGGIVRAVDPANQVVKWTAELGGTVISDFAVDSGTLYVITNPKSASDKRDSFSIVRSLSIDTGITIGSLQIPYADRFWLGTDGYRLMIAGNNGRLHAADKELTQIEWSFESTAPFSTMPVFAGPGLVILTVSDRVFIIGSDDGRLRFEKNWQGRKVRGVAAVTGSSFILGDDRGNLYRSNGLSDKISWSYKAGGAIASLFISGDSVIVSSFDNFIYRISADSGKVLWRRRLPGRTATRPGIAGDAVVVSSVGENFVSLIDLNTGKLITRVAINGRRSPFDTPSSAATNILIIPTTEGFIAIGPSDCRKKNKAGDRNMSPASMP